MEEHEIKFEMEERVPFVLSKEMKKFGKDFRLNYFII